MTARIHKQIQHTSNCPAAVHSGDIVDIANLNEKAVSIYMYVHEKACSCFEDFHRLLSVCFYHVSSPARGAREIIVINQNRLTIETGLHFDS